jgi:hypothetical protein
MEDVVISPEPFVWKCKSLAAAKNNYLNVVDGRVSLVWTAAIMMLRISWKWQTPFGLALSASGDDARLRGLASGSLLPDLEDLLAVPTGPFVEFFVPAD